MRRAYAFHNPWSKTYRVNKNNEPVLKPNLVVDSGKFMDGVDIND